MTFEKPMRIALIGSPNCGKTALFNLLTGARHKVANYAGVTVERREGLFTEAGRTYEVIDLPGAYSLNAMTPDEAITRDMLLGTQKDEAPADLVLMVVDANNLRLNLRLVLEVKQLGYPMVLALNMMDVARERGLVIDGSKLSDELGMPVVDVVAIQPDGARSLLTELGRLAEQGLPAAAHNALAEASVDIVQARQAQVRELADAVIKAPGSTHSASDRIDAMVLHPVLGYALLAVVLFLIFQAVFSWSKWPMDFIKNAVDTAGVGLKGVMPDTILRSLLVDGILSGTGSVLVFLPQIMILFLFILALEDSGYLPRAAFLLDRLMGRVGLSGRAFIPLLSSFACAIPGIMATRTIQNPRERLATIMIAPLMTCSARLPVYALIIAAFIPDSTIGIFNLQGLVLFALYVAGIVSAMAVAFVFKRAFVNRANQPLMLELPNYHWPNLRNLVIGLWERGRIFITRVGTIILTLMILLWFLSTFPSPPDGATGPAIQYSFAGRLGQLLQVVFAPIGFNWQISIALIPGLAAREVAVGALGTVYALSGAGEELTSALTPVIAATWSLPTALSLLAWYVFAPQCLATLSIVKRETNSWKAVLVMAGYMFLLAYLASFATYQISRMLLGAG